MVVSCHGVLIYYACPDVEPCVNTLTLVVLSNTPPIHFQAIIHLNTFTIYIKSLKHENKEK